MITKKRKKKSGFVKTREDIIFDTSNIIFMILLCVVMLYPFLNQIALSLNDASDSVKGGIHLWPREFTLNNYEHVFKKASIMQAKIGRASCRERVEKREDE